MEEIILISYLNDFIFCPVSIYFHKLYSNLHTTLYQRPYQINGTDAHKTIDSKTYSSKSTILQGIDVYTEKYGILGKIDVFDTESGILTERKNKITEIYDGYVYQLYAQYYALEEMGYNVKELKLHSLQDNKTYTINLPPNDSAMNKKFNKLIKDLHEFSFDNFKQTNVKKCKKCIYEPSCDRSLLC